jgi:hypothetical protein
VDSTQELLDEVFAPDAKARLEAVIKAAEKESTVHRDAVLATVKDSPERGLARWHYSHAKERENALKEAWLILTGGPFA